MTNLILNNSGSPFDNIRRIDESGNEFWLATELLEILGYKSWRRQKDTVDRAIISCTNGGSDSTAHFADVVQMAQIGDSAAYRTVLKDFKLSRFACYLVAMNGDPRKPEIATAQSYFAVKTREAETVIPALSEKLEIARLENDNLKMQLELMNRSEAIASMHGVGMLALIKGVPDAVVTIKETVTESIICKDGRTVSFVGKSLAELGKELGFKTGKQLEDWLEKIGRSDLISQGMRAIQAPYVAEEHIKEVKRLWANKRLSAGRQLILGE